MALTGTETARYYGRNYYTTINYPFMPTYEERRRLAAIASHDEFFLLLPLLIEIYEQKLFVVMHRKTWFKLVFFQLMTVKSTCPPSQRSTKGGRRK